MSKELSYPRDKIKFLLLEEIHPAAVTRLKEHGYSVEVVPKSLTAEELKSAIQDVHVLGIRSKTGVAAEHIAVAKNLLAIGCFGVGTNQVDIDAAMNAGVPVFNAPFGNTRSVAELALGMMLCLARKIGDKNSMMHQAQWNKSAKGAIELRGRTVGVVGYGHIGQQLGLLCQEMGMNVLFYDTVRKLPLGIASQVESFKELLEKSDFVSLHVPALPQNRALIGRDELKIMKKGSYLLNLSRGSLIDFSALKESILSGHTAGAGVDVYPKEPKTNKEEFTCELTGVENVILTPHLGGSTEEAQYNIGVEVAQTFIKFIDNGSTSSAVNFPRVDLPELPDAHRILHIHRNVPGVLSDVNSIIGELGANIEAQYLGTFKGVGYLIMDLNRELSAEVKDRISKHSATIRTRILY